GGGGSCLTRLVVVLGLPLLGRGAEATEGVVRSGRRRRLGTPAHLPPLELLLVDDEPARVRRRDAEGARQADDLVLRLLLLAVEADLVEEEADLPLPPGA